VDFFGKPRQQPSVVSNFDGAEVCAPLYIFEHLVGEHIHRYPMSLTSLESQVSAFGKSHTCPRPMTGRGGTPAQRDAGGRGGGAGGAGRGGEQDASGAARPEGAFSVVE
jgi:hypothetical protein